jgi:hypothetical protein
MPAGDRTGPWGRGPMTGRGLGYCGVYALTGYGRAWRWRGDYPRVRGGWDRGWRRRGHAPGWVGPGDEPLSPERELEILRDQAEQLGAELKDIEQRIQDLESD